MGQRHGRWWASRKIELTAADVSAGCVPFLHADDPETFAGQIRAQQARRCLSADAPADEPRGNGSHDHVVDFARHPRRIDHAIMTKPTGGGTTTCTRTRRARRVPASLAVGDHDATRTRTGGWRRSMSVSVPPPRAVTSRSAPAHAEM
jgi:hypothetical protein